MTKSMSSLVATCPDCGGILQPVRPERLTSVEVASADEHIEPILHLQCLLCGFEETRHVEPLGESALPA